MHSLNTAEYSLFIKLILKIMYITRDLKIRIMVRYAMPNRDLRQSGLKVTLPRTNILKILENADPRHLTAEDVYQALREQGEDVSLATVYRVLTQFEAAGLVRRHHFSTGQAVFELEVGAHHDHLVCVRCGAVAEFVDDLIEKRQTEIAEKNHFLMTDHSLIIYGLCSLCKET